MSVIYSYEIEHRPSELGEGWRLKKKQDSTC